MKRNKNSFAALYLLGHAMLIMGCIVSITVCLLTFILGKWGNTESIWVYRLMILRPVSILCCLVFFFITWKKTRKLSYVAMLTALIGMSEIGSIGTLVNHKTATKPTYQVLSYNIGGIAKIADQHALLYEFESLISEILVSQPAIIAFQEYPKQVKASTLDSIYVYQQSHFTDSLSSYGTKIYSRYPIVESQPIVFDRTTSNNALVCHIRIGKDTLQVMNMHLQSTGFNQMKDHLLIPYIGLEHKAQDAYHSFVWQLQENREKRIEQAEMLNTYIATAKTGIIACGDLNTVSHTETYELLTEHLCDAFKTAGFGLSPTYESLFNLFRVDYFLYSPHKIEAQDYTLMPFEHSDHTCISFHFSFK